MTSFFNNYLAISINIRSGCSISVACSIVVGDIQAVSTAIVCCSTDEPLVGLSSIIKNPVAIFCCILKVAAVRQTCKRWRVLSNGNNPFLCAFVLSSYNICNRCWECLSLTTCWAYCCQRRNLNSRSYRRLKVKIQVCKSVNGMSSSINYRFANLSVEWERKDVLFSWSIFHLADIYRPFLDSSVFCCYSISNRCSEILCDTACRTYSCKVGNGYSRNKSVEACGRVCYNACNCRISAIYISRFDFLSKWECNNFCIRWLFMNNNIVNKDWTWTIVCICKELQDYSLASVCCQWDWFCCSKRTWVSCISRRCSRICSQSREWRTAIGWNLQCKCSTISTVRIIECKHICSLWRYAYWLRINERSTRLY